MKKEIRHNHRKRMFKNRTESAKKYKEYLVWLKASRIKTAKIQKEYECVVKALVDEITRCHKEYLAKYAEDEKEDREKVIFDKKDKEKIEFINERNLQLYGRKNNSKSSRSKKP